MYALFFSTDKPSLALRRSVWYQLQLFHRAVVASSVLCVQQFEYIKRSSQLSGEYGIEF